MVSNGVRTQVTLRIQLAAAGSTIPIQSDLDGTVKEFKLVLADLIGIPSDQQCLIYKDRILKDSQTLRSSELEPDQTIHLHSSWVTLQVKLLAAGIKISVQTHLDRTVEEFKRVLTDLTGIPSGQQCLIFRGRVLKNPQTIGTCELEPDQAIDLICRSQVTLQVRLVATGINIPVQTDLNRTVEEFKLVLSYLTGIPSDQQCLVYKGGVIKNPQILKSFELEADHTIHLVRHKVAHNGTNYISDIIESVPPLCDMAKHPVFADLLGTPLGLHYALLYLTHCQLKYHRNILENCARDSSKSLHENSQKMKVKSVFQVHHGISLGLRNYVFLGLLGLNLIFNSGIRSRPESSGLTSSNGTQQMSEPNIQPLPNPWKMTFVLQESHHSVDKPHWKKAFSESVRILLSIISCNATVFGHCKEKFESVDRAFAALKHLPQQRIPHTDRGASNRRAFQLVSSAVQRLVRELDEYFTPILDMFVPHQSDNDHEDPARDEPAS